MDFNAAIDIGASPERVWSILTDVSRWPSWPSGVLRVDGTVAPGAKLAIVSEVDPKRAFKVKVTHLDPPRRLELTGGMPLGLFRGVRTYDVGASGDGTSARVEMQERYSGPMAGLITRSIPDLQPSFETFLTGLRAEAER